MFRVARLSFYPHQLWLVKLFALQEDTYRNQLALRRMARLCWKWMGSFVSLDLETQEFKDLRLFGYEYNFVESYVESLFMLDKATISAITYWGKKVRCIWFFMYIIGIDHSIHLIEYIFCSIWYCSINSYYCWLITLIKWLYIEDNSLSRTDKGFFFFLE